MKRLCKLYLVFIILFVTPVLARAGHGVGNGGNTIALDFVSHMYSALMLLDEQTDPVFEKRSRQDLEKIIARTKVEVVENLPYGRDAENYPKASKPLVRVKASSWKASTESEKLALALHELLGLASIETNTYGYSAAFAERLRASAILLPGTHEVTLKTFAFNSSSSGLDSESTWRLCHNYKKIYADRFFYVFCKVTKKNAPASGFVYLAEYDENTFQWRGYYRHKAHFSEKLLSGDALTEWLGNTAFSLQIVGIGDLTTSRWNTLFDSSIANEDTGIRLIYDDKLGALETCQSILMERSNNLDSGWKYARARCFVEPFGAKYIFKIKSKNPFLLGVNS